MDEALHLHKLVTEVSFSAVGVTCAGDEALGSFGPCEPQLGRGGLGPPELRIPGRSIVVDVQSLILCKDFNHCLVYVVAIIS